MKLISLCSSLLLAGALLFLTSAKPIADKKHDKPLYAYPSINVKNNTDRLLVVNLYYGLNSTPLQQKIKAGATHTFPSSSRLLDKISICCPTPIWSQLTQFVEWKSFGGCGSGCSNFTISANENVGKVILSVTQDQ